MYSPGGWGSKGPGSKGHMLDGHHLRLLDEAGRPIYAEAAGEATRGRKQHPFLPCVEGVAWRYALPVVLDQKGWVWPVDK